MTRRDDIRNIAIIAHVDHGKTTLVDEMLRQSGTFRENQVVAERVMDSGDIERERGITILAKNTAIMYKDVRINIVDTPGHADFGGEVERVLKMVNGVLLLVDAFEGPMPQTRFVLRKALELGHRVIVVVNKVDKAEARPAEVADEVLDLLIDLGAGEDHLDSPFVYASAREGVSSLVFQERGADLTPLLDTILEYVPPPVVDVDGPAQMLVSTIDYNDYVGRIGIGRIERGTLRKGQTVVRCSYDTGAVSAAERVSSMYTFMGLGRVDAEAVSAGEIVAISGMEDIQIGDTLCPPETVEPLPFVKISEPTVAVTFSVNNSPFAGREGKFVTSRHLRGRLERETLSDVSLRVEETDATDAFKVSGRGELHLTVLIENMRRQGYEFQVSKPEVLTREIGGVLHEPVERVVIDVPEQYMGAVMEGLGRRRGQVVSVSGSGRVRLEFLVPSRGLFGYRNEFLTDTRGEGVMSAVFDSYQPMAGDIPTRGVGSLVAHETGEAVQYGLYFAQERGEMFIVPGVPVYAGMIVGRNTRPGDIDLNVCRTKHLTSIHDASGSEDPRRLRPVRPMTLERALEYIEDDELIEITPVSIRLRKRILDATQRMRANRKK